MKLRAWIVVVTLGLSGPVNAAESEREGGNFIDSAKGFVRWLFGADEKLAAANATEDDEELDDEDLPSEDGFTVVDDNDLPHPAQSDAWHTRVLVDTTTDAPDEERIGACVEQVTHFAADATSEDALLATQPELAAEAAQDLEAYHHCFYRLVAKLDLRLAEGGAPMRELATEFFRTARALWLLARSLDALSGRTRYFDYLRDRYVEWQKLYFGRDVQPVGTPLGDLRATDPRL